MDILKPNKYWSVKQHQSSPKIELSMKPMESQSIVQWTKTKIRKVQYHWWNIANWSSWEKLPLMIQNYKKPDNSDTSIQFYQHIHYVCILKEESLICEWQCQYWEVISNRHNVLIIQHESVCQLLPICRVTKAIVYKWV